MRDWCRRGAKRVLLGSSAVALAGCQFLFPTPIELDADSRPSGVARALGDAFLAGESFRAEVYLDGVVAGVGELSVGARCTIDGRPILPVATKGRSAGIIKVFQSASSDVVTLMDAETSLPVEAHWDMTLGERRQVIDQLFSESMFRYRQDRETADKPKRTSFGESKLPVDDVPHDAHTSLGFLRRWQPPAGTRGHLYVVYGRYTWRADLTYRGEELVETPLGKQRASRLDGLATKLLGKGLKPSQLTPRRPFSMWISDDERRIPLRVLVETALAKVTIDIVGYDRSAAIAEAAPVPCVRTVDAKGVEAGLAKKRKREESRKKKEEEERAAGVEPETDDEREEREDREAVEKLLGR